MAFVKYPRGSQNVWYYISIPISYVYLLKVGFDIYGLTSLKEMEEK
jgi:hypothetical protein